MPIGLITYDDPVRREDLIDVITNVSPQATPLLSGNIGTAPDAMGTLHEWMIDSFEVAADNAQVESSDFTVEDHTQPTRDTNITQIFTENVRVSGTEQAVNVAGMADPFQYQLEKKFVAHAKDIELALMRGSRASGDSGVSRRMVGVLNAISTNRSTRASGSSLGETEFNDIMEEVKDTTDVIPDQVYAGSTLRRNINAFTAGSTRFISADDRRLVRPVNIYEGDFGVHEIFWHRNVSNAANAKEFVSLYSPTWMKAWLTNRRTKVIPIAKGGDHDRAQIVSELTLEARNEQASALYDGYTG